MISFSAGGLFGDAFLHLLPEIVELHGFSLTISLSLLLGIIFSFVVEKIIHWRHCHHPTTEDHPHPFAKMNLVGDTVHNFIDGIIIAGSYLVSIPVGIATTIAVVFHEIPQEIGDFGVLLYGGYTKNKALFVNFLTALAAILGAVIALVLSSSVEQLAMFIVPFAAGNFIYIAGADLIPEIHKEVELSKSIMQGITFILGVLVMLGLLFLS
jgi:zinc and cadmium transporter